MLCRKWHYTLLIILFFSETCWKRPIPGSGLTHATQRFGVLFVRTTLNRWHVRLTLCSVLCRSMLTVASTQRWLVLLHCATLSCVEGWSLDCKRQQYLPKIYSFSCSHVVHALGWEDYSLDIFHIKGFPLQSPDWEVIYCNGFILHISQHIMFSTLSLSF